MSNGSAPKVNFDNFHVSLVQGKIRQINDYYPYGMAIYGLNGDYDDYLNKYTGKEYQTGEFDPSISQGLEMFDFGSRFYDAQLGRWHAPDPAEQFSNPYLAMGNNPVTYVDPDGEWVNIVVGAVIGGITGGLRARTQGKDVVDGIFKGMFIGALSSGLVPIGGAGLTFAADVGLATAQGAAIGALDAHLWNTNVGKGAFWGGVTAATMFTVTSSNMKNWMNGKEFKNNHNVFKDFQAGKYTKEGGKWQQDALTYFKMKNAEYRPGFFEPKGPPGAGTIDKHGNLIIKLNNEAFLNYDNLRITYDKEKYISSLSYSEFMKADENLLEYEGFVQVFENRSLYPNNTFDARLHTTINDYGNKAGLPQNGRLFLKDVDIDGIVKWNDVGPSHYYIPKFKNQPWYYRIPRRF